MKRKVVASILGIAASTAMVASSYGQGSVFFNNLAYSSGSGTSYDPGINVPVSYGSGPNTGVLVDGANGFQADLLYQFGTGALTVLTAANANATPYPTPFGTGGAIGYFSGPV